MSEIRAVCFDLGETLTDETAQWTHWADVVQVPSFTFMAVLGAVIARGEHHRRVFEILAPGFDPASAPAAPHPTEADLYPDVRPALANLRESGYRLAVAANQPAGAAGAIASFGLALDLVATSAEWGVEKPDPAFFARLAAELGEPPATIAYVGDRVDNDVGPAATAGLRAVFLRRGPWAFVQCPQGRPGAAEATVESLGELPAALARLAGRVHRVEQGPPVGRLPGRTDG